jgi:hypothetical protein
MRASSNNHYQKSLPFTDIQIHSNKFSEDDTGYDSLPKQQRINSTAGLSSSSSSSNNQFDRIMNLVKSIPSPTDISTAHDTSDIALSVAQRIAQFSKPTTTTTTPLRKLNRTRIQPIPDSTSDSADSFALSNHVVLVSSYPQKFSSIDMPPFGGNLEYIHDNRFDSTTTVDHVKNDVIAIELMDKQQPNQIIDTLPYNKQKLSWIKRLGESIRLLPANVLAVVFIGLIGGLIVSAILVLIIA